MVRILTTFLRKIPILCGLPDCNASNHLDAIREVGSNFLISTLPISLSVIGFIANSTAYKKSFHIVLGHGELFMYCTSLLAPMFYLVLKEFHGLDDARIRKFPGRLSHILLVASILAICCYLFGILRTDTSTLDKELIYLWSIRLYFISLGILYLATVYDKSRIIPYNEEMTSEETDMSNKLGDLHHD